MRHLSLAGSSWNELSDVLQPLKYDVNYKEVEDLDTEGFFRICGLPRKSHEQKSLFVIWIDGMFLSKYGVDLLFP